MSTGSEKCITLELPTAAAFDALEVKLDRILAVLGSAGDKIECGDADDSETGSTGKKKPYLEPGPGSPRQYFTAKELMSRFGLSKTTVYEIPEFELPQLRKNGWIRYHWAHVWAYEGRITGQQADALYHGSVSETEQQLLSSTTPRPARVRQLRPGQLSGTK